MGICGQSSDDEDKQQLFVDFFLSRCELELEILSSSVVVFVAGKHNGGGGNFFDRNKKFADEEFASIWINNPIFVILLACFLMITMENF